MEMVVTVHKTVINKELVLEENEFRVDMRKGGTFYVSEKIPPSMFIGLLNQMERDGYEVEEHNVIIYLKAYGWRHY